MVNKIYSVDSEPSPAPSPIPPRFQYLGETVGLPLEITSSLKTYGRRGTVSDVAYRPEEDDSSDWGSGRKRLWKWFRWFLLFSALVLVLGVVVYYLLIDVRVTSKHMTTAEDEQTSLTQVEEDKYMLNSEEPVRIQFQTDFGLHGSNGSVSQDLIEIVEAPDFGTPSRTEPNFTYQQDDGSHIQEGSSYAVSYNTSRSSQVERNNIKPGSRLDEEEEIMMTSDRDLTWERRITNGHSRQPVHPTLPSSIVKKTSVVLKDSSMSDNETNSSCFSPRLDMCKGVLPYDLTTLPTIPGFSRLEDLDAALPYFEMILESKCSQRSRQFICSLLEPACQPMRDRIIPPCRKACRAVAEECSDFMLTALDLSKVFLCDVYPDVDDPTHCVNFAKGEECLLDEFRCPEGSCIPKRWRCDSVNDCSLAADEANCSHCSNNEMRCQADNRCIPLKWRCDGNSDCTDGSDELHCPIQESSGQPHTSPCPVSELRCLDGRCITMQQLCDGVYDCSDGADEANCGS